MLWKKTNLWQIVLALGQIMSNPVHHRRKHLLFIAHIELVAANDTAELCMRQHKELLSTRHLSKVLLRVFLSYLQQFPARMSVGKRADPQTITRVQLRPQKLTTNLLHLLQLKNSQIKKNDISSFQNVIFSKKIFQQNFFPKNILP